MRNNYNALFTKRYDDKTAYYFTSHGHCDVHCLKIQYFTKFKLLKGLCCQGELTMCWSRTLKDLGEACTWTNYTHQIQAKVQALTQTALYSRICIVYMYRPM